MPPASSPRPSTAAIPDRGECESCRSFAEGRSYSIHELDAASNNSVDDIRALTDKVRIPPQVGRYSVYIIDEVHMLSQQAFNAFLKTLEEPPAHAIFILATTEKHKILPTILSRCQTFDFNRIGIEDMVRNMKAIAAKEGVTMSEEAMHIIAQKADGAMRDALTLFDQTVAFCGKEVTYEQVIRNLGVLDYDYYFNLTDHFLSGDYAHAMLTFDEILSKGFNAQSFIGGLSTHFRDLIVCKNEASRTLLHLAPTVAKRYLEYASRCPMGFLFEALSITSNCEAAYKQSGNPRLLIEFALMKLCNLTANLSAGASAAEPRPAEQKVAEPKPAAPKPVEAKPVEPQPVVNNPAPQPSRPSKPTGLSIKAMMAEAKHEPVAAAQTEAEAAEKPAPDPATLQEAWTALAASEAKMPRLSSALSQATPTLSDKEIHFTVGNLAQKDWIDRNCRPRLESFLQKKLGDGAIRLVVDVKQADETPRGMYMPSEKAKYLQENSPEFNALKKDFELEIN